MKNAVAMALELIGIAFLVVGYKKSNRNFLLLGAGLLWVGGSLGDNDIAGAYFAGRRAAGG